MFGIIYKATCKINNKVYIGQTTKTMQERKKQHLHESSSGRTHFYYAIRKHGVDNFTWEEIAVASSREELDSLESRFIEEYNSLDPIFGYNGKTGGSRGQNSPKIRQKISESVRNSASFRKAMEDPVLRAHRSELRRGSLHSEETKKKMSSSALGNKNAAGTVRSPETRSKIQSNSSGKNNHNVFPLQVTINGKEIVWEEGFRSLRLFLMKEYELEVNETNLQALCNGTHTHSRKAREKGIDLQIKRFESESSKR